MVKCLCCSLLAVKAQKLRSGKLWSVKKTWENYNATHFQYNPKVYLNAGMKYKRDYHLYALLNTLHNCWF